MRSPIGSVHTWLEPMEKEEWTFLRLRALALTVAAFGCDDGSSKVDAGAELLAELTTLQSTGVAFGELGADCALNERNIPKEVATSSRIGALACS